MPYVNNLRVLGDGATQTSNNGGPGPTLAEQIKTQQASEQAAADAGSKFAKNAVDELSHQAYAQAVATGVVPAYVTSPADQKTFTSLVDRINAGGFTSLSPQDQVTFNALRTTGTTDIDAARVGGKESGVYTNEGTDLPPNADVIAKAVARDTAPGYAPPAAAAPAGRGYTIRNGAYVYLDDGSAVPASELARLGLRVVNTTATPAAAAAGPSAAANYPVTKSSLAPSDTLGPTIAPAPVLDETAAVPSSNKALWLIGAGGVGLGLVAFAASRSSHRRS